MPEVITSYLIYEIYRNKPEKMASLQSTNKKNNQNSMAEQRSTRSNKGVSSCVSEKQTKNLDLAKVTDELGNNCKFDGKINKNSSLKVIKNSKKDDDVVAQSNMNPKVVLTPLNHKRKNAEETYDFDKKKQRKRVNQKFWENKLTGACRISRRLKNSKLKGKDFDKDSKKNNKRYPRIPSSKKLGHSLKSHVKRHMSLNSSESTNSFTVTNNSTNMKSEENVIVEDINNATMIAPSNNPTINEVASHSITIDEDDVIVSQCSSDEVILQESTHDKESSELEDNQTVSATNVEFDSTDDLECVICVESTLEVLNNEEIHEQVKQPSEPNDVSPLENVCEETEIKTAESSEGQSVDSLPTTEN